MIAQQGIDLANRVSIPPTRSLIQNWRDLERSNPSISRFYTATQFLVGGFCFGSTAYFALDNLGVSGTSLGLGAIALGAVGVLFGMKITEYMLDDPIIMSWPANVIASRLLRNRDDQPSGSLHGANIFSLNNNYLRSGNVNNI